MKDEITTEALKVAPAIVMSVNLTHNKPLAPFQGVM